MHWLAGVAGAAMILIVLWEGFESIVLPRRVTRRFRLTRLFYRRLWGVWRLLARTLKRPLRDRFVAWFGPLSMIFLLILWALGLIFGFAFLHWSLGSPLQMSGYQPGFFLDLYLSGSTFVTLGLGDVVPRTDAARVLTVVEAGTGFGFLAMVIGYLPVLYQSFAQRERVISLLDARAGSPSTPAELLARHALAGALDDLDALLREWEEWSSGVLESHVSYPALSYFRSQHDNQSWLACLTTALDTCAVLVAGVRGVRSWQAQLTFAMARHTVVDLAQIFNTPPRPPVHPRLGPGDSARLRELLVNLGLPPAEPASFDGRVAELHQMYEPYVDALAEYLMLTLPGWFPRGVPVDNWRTSAWEHRSTGLPRTIFEGSEDVHY